MTGLSIESEVPLAPRTTLELGGNARFYLRATSEADIIEGMRWAKNEGHPVSILGGGSNLVVADSGFEGLVIHVLTRGVEIRTTHSRTEIEVQAGEPWDAFVDRMVDAEYAGIECLTGIPGYAGATPIQNVGAYGQEVAESITAVRVLTRDNLHVESLKAADCAFSYRDSRFKRNPDTHVVLSVTFALTPGGSPAVRYRELEEALGNEPRTLRSVRDSVRTLRARKSMLIDPLDENRRSAGSFFTNPIVSIEDANRVVERAIARGAAKTAEDVPRYPVDSGHTKLAAGWLIERSGIQKGYRRGPIGVSSRHALSIVHHGGGTTQQLVEFARELRARVYEAYDVELVPEPAFLGHSGLGPIAGL